MNKGQIGRIMVQKPINLWKRTAENKLQFVRVLKPGEVTASTTMTLITLASMGWDLDITSRT